MSEQPFLAERRKLQERLGKWTTDILLPDGGMTRDEAAVPEPRLRRIVQIISDLAPRPWSELRILDLGSLEGLFPLEFGLRGATVVGVEGRKANVEKGRFALAAHRLDRVRLEQADVRSVSRARLGGFDVIVCSGILYHLDASSAFALLERLFEMCEGFLVIDTHISLKVEAPRAFRGHTYWGRAYVEHAPDATPEMKEQSVWASLDNVESFWFTRQSLLQLLQDLGFSSAYQCENPVMNGLADRQTFVAVRGERQRVMASSVAPELEPHRPEESPLPPPAAPPAIPSSSPPAVSASGAPLALGVDHPPLWKRLARKLPGPLYRPLRAIYRGLRRMLSSG